MTEVFERVLKKKEESGLTWSKICKKSKIPMSSWMTGAPCFSPTDEELKKIAPVLNTTYEYLKYGKEN